MRGMFCFRVVTNAHAAVCTSNPRTAAALPPCSRVLYGYWAIPTGMGGACYRPRSLELFRRTVKARGSASAPGHRWAHRRARDVWRGRDGPQPHRWAQVRPRLIHEAAARLALAHMLGRAHERARARTHCGDRIRRAASRFALLLGICFARAMCTAAQHSPLSGADALDRIGMQSSARRFM